MIMEFVNINTIIGVVVHADPEKCIQYCQWIGLWFSTSITLSPLYRLEKHWIESAKHLQNTVT